MSQSLRYRDKRKFTLWNAYHVVTLTHINMVYNTRDSISRYTLIIMLIMFKLCIYIYY